MNIPVNFTPIKTNRQPGSGRSCPVEGDAARVIQQGRGMLAALRRLKRSQRFCQRCADRSGCPALEQFNLLIQQAVHEVIEEWDSANA